MILGITGGTGCGKTTLLNLIRQRGGLVLDCDEIYHQLLEKDQALLDSIRKKFPDAFEAGLLNRKKLGAIVFSDSEALQELNRITHAAVRQEVIRLLADAPKHAAIDAIGLFEGGLAALCDLTVAVTAPYDLRIARLMERDKISRDYAAARIQAQHDNDWFRRHCDVTLENNQDLDKFTEECLAFLDTSGIISRG